MAEGTSLSLVSSCDDFQQEPATELDLSTEVATRLKLIDQEAPAAVAPETHSFDTAHQRYSSEGIPRLTKVRSTARNQIRCGLLI